MLWIPASTPAPTPAPPWFKVSDRMGCSFLDPPFLSPELRNVFSYFHAPFSQTGFHTVANYSENLGLPKFFYLVGVFGGHLLPVEFSSLLGILCKEHQGPALAHLSSLVVGRKRAAHVEPYLRLGCGSLSSHELSLGFFAYAFSFPYNECPLFSSWPVFICFSLEAVSFVCDFNWVSKASMKAGLWWSWIVGAGKVAFTVRCLAGWGEGDWITCLCDWANSQSPGMPLVLHKYLSCGM